MRRLFRAQRDTFHGPYCMNIDHDLQVDMDLYSVECKDPKIEPGDPAKAAIPLRPDGGAGPTAAQRAHETVHRALARKRAADAGMQHE